MRFSDASRAASAGQLLFVGFAVNLGMTVAMYAFNWLVPLSFDSPVRIVEELGWLAVGLLITVALFQLANVWEEGRSLVMSAAGLWALSVVFDVLSMASMHFLSSGSMPASLSQLINDVDMLISMVGRALLFLALVQLTKERAPWVLPVLGTSLILSLARSGLMFAIGHDLGGRELLHNGVYRLLMPMFSFFNGFAVLAAAWVARDVLRQVVVPQTMPGQIPVPPAVQPVSPASDFIAGGLLLAVGVGVTAVSLAASSNGGRYIVATGAIGVGIGRLIRGFIRLAKQ